MTQPSISTLHEVAYTTLQNLTRLERTLRKLTELSHCVPEAVPGADTKALAYLKTSDQATLILIALKFTGSNTPMVLADLIGLDRSNVTRLLNALEDLGLVSKESVEGDKRLRLLRLTKQGSLISEAVLDALARRFKGLGAMPFRIEDLSAFLTSVLDELATLAEEGGQQ